MSRYAPYGARLKGQANVCKYVQQYAGCGANMDYTEAILRDVLCRGLEDADIQMDLLGDKNQDMTLEQALKFVEAKEAGKRSASHLLLPQATDAVLAARIGGRRNCQPESRLQRIKISAHTVGPSDTEEFLQRGPEELNAQPTVQSAITMAGITTSSRCAGEKLIQDQREALDVKMPYSTHYVRHMLV